MSLAAANDFLSIITTCHILAATMKLFGMEDLNAIPVDENVNENTWMLPDKDRKKILILLCRRVVDTYTNFKFDIQSPPEPSDDHINAYAVEVMSLGLFYLSFKDAIKYGYGVHTLRCWKYFIPIFKASDRRNYSIEAFLTLYQYHFMLSPRQAHQLVWSRFINTRGLPGHNIECDLHMEHLNRICKNSIKGMGANKTEKAIQRAAKAIGKSSAVVDNFARTTKHPSTSQKHSSADVTKDRDLILKELTSNNVFGKISGREHASFPNLSNTVMMGVGEKKLTDWIKDQIFLFS